MSTEWTGDNMFRSTAARTLTARGEVPTSLLAVLGCPRYDMKQYSFRC